MVIGGVVLVLAGFVALAYLPASSARGHLLEGRRHMEEGKALLAAGDTPAARQSFLEAKTRFEKATASARGPLLRAAAWIPLLRRTPNAIVAIGEAGGEVASAGLVLTDTLDGLPGGLAALAPRDGAIPLGPLPTLEAGLERAEELAARALARIRGAAGTFLVGAVAEARRELLHELSTLHSVLATGRDLVAEIPGFLGRDGPRQYFFGVQNPAEIRGTGGLMGAYSILTIEQGRLVFSEFSPTQNLTNFTPEELEPPSEDYARNYDQFGGAGFWQNINMTPHFPWAAGAIIAAYAEDTGVALDGVVVADPFALQALLAATGPIEMPPLGRLTEGRVVPFMTNEAYQRFEDPATRKRILGDVASAIVQRFLLQEDASAESVRGLAATAAEGHVLVYSTDPELQSAFERTGAGGTFGGPPGDFLSVVENNGSGNKLDFYTTRSVTYDVRLGRGGTAQATVGVSIENDSPDVGLPAYVIGPFPGVSAAGEIVPILNLYCAATCTVPALERDGTPADLRRGTELGYPFAQHYFRVPSGTTAQLDYSLTLDHAWDGNDSGGTYRLTYLAQTTIRPTSLRIDVVVPPGMKVIEATEPMRIEGDRAVFEGVPPRRLEIEVRFAPSLPLRLWRNAVRFFNQPVVDL
jgi:Protein of unknown function (DUF4012)